MPAVWVAAILLLGTGLSDIHVPVLGLPDGKPSVSALAPPTGQFTYIAGVRPDAENFPATAPSAAKCMALGHVGPLA